MLQGCNCNDLRTLLCSIETSRNQLQEKVRQSEDIRDPQVIQASRELDALLNRFHRVTSSLLSEQAGLPDEPGYPY